MAPRMFAWILVCIAELIAGPFYDDFDAAFGCLLEKTERDLTREPRAS